MRTRRDGKMELNKGIHVRKSRCNSKHMSRNAKKEDQVSRYHVAHVENIR